MASRAFRSCAFLGSLSGHLFLLISLLNVQPSHREAPEHVAGLVRVGSGYSIDQSVLVFIEEEGSAIEVDRPAPPALDGSGPMHLTLRIFEPKFPDLSEIDDADGTANAAEPAPALGDDSAELLRRYLAQMRARIDRAWEASLEGREGLCRVVLNQDARGEILAYQVSDCSLDSGAQEMLLAAVRRASPLAPPPDARLFLPRVTLDFGTQAQVQSVDETSRK